MRRKSIGTFTKTLDDSGRVAELRFHRSSLIKYTEHHTSRRRALLLMVRGKYIAAGSRSRPGNWRSGKTASYGSTLKIGSILPATIHQSR